MRASVRACERAKLCERVRDDVPLAAGLGELKIDSGRPRRPDFFLEENNGFAPAKGWGGSQPASRSAVRERSSDHARSCEIM